MSLNIIALDRDSELPAEAGGKARGLQLVARAGLPFPPTWVIVPGASSADIDRLAEELGAIPTPVLAVRSSARDEDDIRSSFAGIHESRIGVPLAELPQAVAEVAASAVTERARAYRAQLGIRAPDGPCAVLVQPLLSSACSGVAFGVGRGPDRVVIEAVEGLGETAVHGDATPERHFLLRAGGEWKHERIEPRRQPVALLVRDGRIESTPLSGNRRHERILTDDLPIAIARGVENLERLAGRSLDVEWARAGDTLWFLQARPQTRPLTEGLPAGEIWSRANVRDVLPEIPTALTRSMVRGPIDAGVRAHLAEYGVRIPDDIPLFAFVYGSPVFSGRTLVVGDMLGVSRAAMQAEFGGAAEADDRVIPMNPGKAIRHPRVLFRAFTLPAAAEGQATSFLDSARDLRRRLESIPPADTPSADLLELLTVDAPQLSRRFAQTGMRVVAAVTNAQYPALWRLRRHASPRALIARLLAGGEPSVSTRQIDDLIRLADEMREWTGAAAFLHAMARERAPLNAWCERMPEAAGHLLTGWLRQYGHRGPYESDLASPRYVEDLRLMARLLLPLVEHGNTSQARSPRQRREAADRAWEEVERLVGPRGRRLTERDLHRVQRLTGLREEVRSETSATMLHMRRIVQTLADRLARQGRIKSRDDVWHLSIDELRHAVTQPRFGAEFAVAREIARRAAWRRIDVPNSFTTEDIPGMSLSARVAPAGASYTGNGISPGTAEGIARILRTPDDADRLGVGDVLVAPATDPGWTPLFPRASAIVVEVGGALSHAGIVAREFGIPCVANIDGATRSLQDGDLVRVNGTSGEVTIVSNARPTESPVHREERGSS